MVLTMGRMTVGSGQWLGTIALCILAGTSTIFLYTNSIKHYKLLHIFISKHSTKAPPLSQHFFCLSTMSTLLLLLFLLLKLSEAYKAEWICVEPKQVISPRRSGAVAILPPLEEPTMPPLVFGGYAEEDTTDSSGPKYRRYAVNDLWQWRNEQWNIISPIKGDSPAARLVGAAACLGNSAYLVGGWSPEAESPSEVFLDTVHQLDLKTFTWKLLPTKLPDGPSSRHIAVALSTTEILIHNHRCVDYVYLFDGQEFTKQPTKGSCPSPRGLHCACRVSEDCVIVFGGAAQDGTMSNEVFSLNTRTWKWQQLKTTNHGPSPRAAACLCTVDSSHVLLYGGAESVEGGLKPHGDTWLLDLERLTWTCLISSDDGSAPPPRNAATLFPLKKSEQGNDFLMTGGWAPFVETWDDCHVLRISKS